MVEFIREDDVPFSGRNRKAPVLAAQGKVNSPGRKTG
jgi:hypothetical protein